MIRSVALITAAIGLANPGLGVATRTHYAKTVQAVCKRASCDPLTIVSMVEFESRWRASARLVRGQEEYVGLGQVRLRNYPACGDLKSSACAAKRAELLNPHHNLRVIGATIQATRKYCRKRTGRPALFARWLAVYQGVDAVRGTTCNQRRVRGKWVDQPLHRLTLRVMRRRTELARRLK
jgi:hypothetical protein